MVTSSVSLPDVTTCMQPRDTDVVGPTDSDSNWIMLLETKCVTVAPTAFRPTLKPWLDLGHTEMWVVILLHIRGRRRTRCRMRELKLKGSSLRIPRPKVSPMHNRRYAPTPRNDTELVNGMYADKL